MTETAPGDVDMGRMPSDLPEMGHMPSDMSLDMARQNSDVMQDWSYSNVSVKNTFIDIVVPRAKKKAIQRHTSEPVYSSGQLLSPVGPVFDDGASDDSGCRQASIRQPSIKTNLSGVEEGSEDLEASSEAQSAGADLQHCESEVPEGSKNGEEQEQGDKPQEITTMMMRNLPNKYKRQMLLEEIEESGFTMGPDFDFFYLPMDHRRDANLGYCFLNFVNGDKAKDFTQVFAGTKLKHHLNSNKKIVITPALIQGFEANRAFLSSASVKTDKQREYRPAFAPANQKQQHPQQQPQQPQQQQQRLQPQQRQPQQSTTPGKSPKSGQKGQNAQNMQGMQNMQNMQGAHPAQAQLPMGATSPGKMSPQWMGLSTSPPLASANGALTGDCSPSSISQILAPFLLANEKGPEQETANPTSPVKQEEAASGELCGIFRASGGVRQQPQECVQGWVRPGSAESTEPPSTPTTGTADWTSWPASPFGVLEGGLERPVPGSSPAGPRLRSPNAPLPAGAAASPKGPVNSGITLGSAALDQQAMKAISGGKAEPVSPTSTPSGTTVAAADRKLFVGGVPQELGEEDLYTVFAVFGKVKKAWLQRGRNQGEVNSAETAHRGFGFVVFNDKDSLDRLLGHNKSQFILLQGGKRLEVKRAVRSKDVLNGRRSSTASTQPSSMGDGQDEPGSPTSPSSLAGAPDDASPTSSPVQCQKVFVGGIPQEMNQDDLYAVFSRFGHVKKTWLQVSHNEGQNDASRAHRGFGFVIFHDASCVNDLLGDKTSHFLIMEDGRRLEVKRAIKSRGSERIGGAVNGSAQPDATNTTLLSSPAPLGVISPTNMAGTPGAAHARVAPAMFGNAFPAAGMPLKTTEAWGSISMPGNAIDLE